MKYKPDLNELYNLQKKIVKNVAKIWLFKKLFVILHSQLRKEPFNTIQNEKETNTFLQSDCTSS